MTDLLPGVVCVFSGEDSELRFRGTGVVVAAEWVLTCKHVVMETDPFGQPTDQPLANVIVRSASDEHVGVARTILDEELDLAALELERKLDIVPPLFVWGLTKAMETAISSCPLTAYGYAQGNRGKALWQHEIRDLRFFYTHLDETLTEVQSAGGIPAGCSGGPVLLPFTDRALYFGTVYLGGERSATSRVITADPAAQFLDRAGVTGVGRIDAPRALSLATWQGDATAIPAEYPLDPRQRPNPYRGLAYFREVDAPYFFGRQQETAELCTLVEEHSLVTLLGASGSGKSSLVLAGLVPRIRRSKAWRVIICRPRGDAFREVATRLCSLIYRDLDKLKQLKKRNELDQNLKDGSLSLADSVEAWAEESTDLRLLLVVDQFEELYAGNKPAAQTTQFIDGLLSLARRGLPCTVLLSLRADFLGEVLSHGPMADALDTAPKKILGPMDENAQRAAIVEPARQLGVRLESGLPERIMSDVGGEPGNLPLLEFALAELWEKQTDGLLTHAAYNSGGGALGALARYADAVVDRLRSEEARVRQVFVQLVQPGEGANDLRRVAMREQIGEANWPLINKLADSRLVTTDRNEDGEETAEIVHEALIRYWPQLQRWVEQERQFRTWQERLRQALKDWESQERDEDALLRGARLVEAEERLRTNEAAIGDAERGYIDASLKLRALDRRVERRARATLVASLAAGLVAAIGLSIWANLERQQAREAHEIAIEQKESAVAAQAEAEQERNAALARQLAAQAELLLETSQPDLLTAALLVIESLRRQRTLEGYLVWSKAMRVLPRKAIVLRHDDEVTDLDFSPDGKRLATASWDKTVSIWDLVTGKNMVNLDHPDRVLGVAFSPDGTRLATASDDGLARIWDVRTAREIITFRHADKVLSMSFSPDGGRLVTGSADMTARIWDIESGAELLTLIHDGLVQKVAFAKNGERIATASLDGTSRIWDSRTGRPIGSPVRDNPVRSISLGANGSVLASTSGGNAAIVWNVENSNELKRFTHDGSVFSVAFSPDETLLATASSDGTARLWEVATGKEIARLKHGFWVTDVTFSIDGERVATASGDRTARIWDVSTGRELLRMVHNEPPRAVAFSPDGRYMATISSDRTVRVWAVTEEAEIAELINPAQVNSVTFSADGTRLATTSVGGAAIVWDTQTAQPVTKLLHQGGISAVALNPDGTRIAVGGLDGVTRVWDTKDRIEITRLSAESRILAVAFDPGGDRLATASAGTVRIWNFTKGAQVIELPHAHMIWSLAFDPRGRFLATAGSDKVASVWEFASGNAVARLTHDDYVLGLAFTPDGLRLATSSQDGSTRIWDLEARREVLRVFGNGIANDIAFSPDGGTLVTSGLDRTVSVWETHTGKEFARFTQNGEAGAVAFSRDGSLLISASFHTDIGLWRSDSSQRAQRPLPLAAPDGENALITDASVGSGLGEKVWLRSLPWRVEDLVKEACSVIERNLAKREWAKYLGTEPYRPTCVNLAPSAE